jgi:16S rRNA (adenine1518-N6/adenine1519-N6)-dimethyltransferase
MVNRVQTLAQIKEMLESRGLAPRHSLGQNFLVDHNLIRKLVDASGLREGSLVLEVGPGTGVLTEELLSRGCRVVACELDRGLAAMLRERLADRVTLIEGDCLASKSAVNPDVIAALKGEAFVLVANLPYGAATPLMLALLVDHPSCASMHVTIQKEVADRLLAAPRTSEYGPISIVAQALARVERIATLPRECFWPRPDVTSAMVSLSRRADPLTEQGRALADFCQEMFSKRRKQLGSVLGRGHAFPAGIEPENRMEELSVPQAVALFESARYADPRSRS